MKRALFMIFFVLLSASAGFAQSKTVKVKLRVVLVDQALNQKPVPFFTVRLKSAAAGSKIIEVKTALDGTVETELAAGRYVVATPKPIEFAGKRYSWSLQVALAGAEKNIELTNDNAKIEESAAVVTVPVGKPASEDLTEQFKRLRNTVVTVQSESGHGTGFFVDRNGLVLTNQHVVANSEYLAVQFDRTHKIVARLIATDSEKDVALLWVNMAAFPGAIPAPLYRASASKTPVEEGERVFTIGSPLNLDKIITTGIVSKVEAHTIMSDVNINSGNSGGPLFNAAGQVIGLTTFGTRGETGPGVSGVVRIEEALALLEQNRAKASGKAPSDALLPVEPSAPYPTEGLKAALKGEKYDPRPYYFSAGDFDIALSTPPLDYREQEEKRLQADREHQKRDKRHADTETSADDADVPKGWESDAGGRRAVFAVYVLPKTKQGGSAFGRVLLPNAQAKLKFRTDFERMKLFCGDKEVQPIHPGKIPVSVSIQNRMVRMDDSTFKGVYTYTPDAISPDCGQVKIEIYSSKGGEPAVKILDDKTVQHVWADFDAFRKVQGTATQASTAKP